MFAVDDVQVNAVVPETGSTTADGIAEVQVATEAVTNDSMTSIQRTWVKKERSTCVPVFTLKTGAIRELLHKPDC